ncbi:MAG: murein L,D-transpeptidase catalytic domain family protein [Nevskiales bacterium]
MLAAGTASVRAESPLWQSLAQVAPKADPAVIRLAVEAMNCAQKSGEQHATRLAVIDYSRPSTEARMWIFDLDSRKLLFKELVAHGRNSGDNYAVSFSDKAQSYQSSLGLYRTLRSYDGNNGYSLRLEGLEAGINQNALDRAIVIHGADYVSEDFAKKVGRIGRSYGCPAVRQEVARPLIDKLKGGNYLFVYYPDTAWLNSSRYLRCDAKTNMAQTDTAPQQSR